MARLGDVAVWFLQDGSIVCRWCREDLIETGTPMRMAHVKPNLMECAHCLVLVGHEESRHERL